MESPSLILGGIIILMFAIAMTLIAVLTSIFIIVLLNKILPFLTDKPPKQIPYECWDCYFYLLHLYVYCRPFYS